MSWKSKIIINILEKMAPVHIRHKRQTTVTILAGHRILAPKNPFPWDDGVITADPEVFAEMVSFFKENFHCTTFGALKACLQAGGGLPPASLILTFDDGYRDIYSNAYPILRQFGVPACVFLSVKHVETGQPFWWDEASFHLKSMHRTQEEIMQFLRIQKRIPDPIRRLNLEAVASLSICGYNHGLLPMERLPITWGEILEMSEHGIEFGSHTMTHPVLSRLEREEDLEYEIATSKRILEERLRKPVVAFAYPVGGPAALNARVKEKVQQTGYTFAVTYSHGINDFTDPDLDPLSLKRIDLDHESVQRVKIKTAYPELFKR